MLDSPQDYEDLLEFVYLSPSALARMDETGAIDMMNPMGASLLAELSSAPVITNLLEVLDHVDPEVRQLVGGFTAERGFVCEARRIEVACAGRGTLVLLLTLRKLGPGRIMAAFSDVSNLAAAHRAQQVLLEAVSDGLVVVDRMGCMSGQCSAALATWLGRPVAGQTLWDYLAPASPEVAARMKLGWEQLVENVLPVELSLDQLPARLTLGRRTLGITYRAFMSDEVVTQVLVMMHDLTAELLRDELEADRHELVAAMASLVSDGAGFSSFVEEASALIAQLGSLELDTVEARCLVHTLKGNAAAHGLRSISSACHAIEDKVWLGEPSCTAERAALTSRWAELSRRFAPLLGERHDEVRMSRDEHARLLARIDAGVPTGVLRRELARLALSPVRVHLTRLGEHALQLGARLDRGPIGVRIEDGGARHAEARFARFWSSAIHAVQNAVDHGIETKEERARAGKPPVATLELRAEERDGLLVVEVRDDGRGVDWSRIADRARALGLPSGTREELIAALFSDGISSREEVSETSGRGTGMRAMKAECESLGATVEVESQVGRGTTLRFLIPLSRASPSPRSGARAARSVSARPARAP